MSLQGKLEMLTKKTQEQKKVKVNEEEEKQLKPVRGNIKNLLATRRDLDLIKRSLDFKEVNKPEQHIGMKDYAEITGKKVKSESGKLDTLITVNKEALDALGIEDREQLAANPEFAEESEVVNYKKAVKQGKELEMSDEKLKERLAKLGVEVDAKNFSYESASQALEEKIQILDNELINEKLKTPEGREEIVNNLANEFSKSTGEMNLGSFTGFSVDRDRTGRFEENKPDFRYGLDLDGRNFHIDITGDKTSLKEWSNLKLIPGNFSDIKDTYSEEVAQQALEKTYQNKIHQNFIKWDETGDKTEILKKRLEMISPESKKECRVKLDEFVKKQGEAEKVIEEKSKEFKEKGINFSTVSITGYGGSYKQLLEIDNYENVKDVYANLSKNDFPPRYNFQELQKVITERIATLNKFIEAVQSLKDKDDIYEFSNNDKSSIFVAKFESYHTDLREKACFDFSFKGQAGTWNEPEFRRMTANCKSYEGAEEYVNKIVAKNRNAENKIVETIKIAIRAQIAKINLEQEIKEAKIGNYIGDIKSRLEHLEYNKNEAIKILGSVKMLAIQLPKNEELILNKGIVVVPSIDVEYERIRTDRTTEKQKLDDKKREIANHKLTEPRLFGKKDWRKKMNDLSNEEAALKEIVVNLEKKNTKDLYYQSHYDIPTTNHELEKIINAQEAKGNSSEILNNLQAELTKVIDATLPAKILQDYAEYNALAEKIS